MMDTYKKFWSILLSLLLLSIFVLPNLATNLQAQQVVKLSHPGAENSEATDLSTDNDSVDDNWVEILIILKEQTDTAAVALEVKARQASSADSAQAIKTKVRHAVAGALQENAERSQKPLLNFLKAESARGRVVEVKSFFIINLVYARVSAEVVDEIIARPDVATVKPNASIQLVEPLKGSVLPQINNIEWNITRINAPAIWDAGIDGSGVVVGFIDTGADWQHEALKQKYRGYDHSNPDRPSNAYNWFDPFYNTLFPDDNHGHGSHVKGIVLGADEKGMNQIGVAPGAKWIAARGFNNQGLGTAADLLAAGQFLLAPTPNSDGSGVPDPSKAPDIINNSWGRSAPGDLDEWYRLMVQSWRDAAILPVFAAGNKGPGEATLLSPGYYPESFSVAATDHEDKLAWFSSRGPAPYSVPNDLKPDIAAPGVNIRSVQSGSPDRERGYEVKSGTSMAAPHIAGIAALVIQSDPSLNVDQIQAIILDSALSRTDGTYNTSPNYGYGYGLADAFYAVSGESPSFLTASFDSGTWWYNAYFKNWNRYSKSTAIAITHADINKDGKLNFIGSYPTGTWYRNGDQWEKITDSTARALSGYPDGWMAASFVSGTWIYDAHLDGGTWYKISSSTAHALTWLETPVGMTLVASFDSGTWFYKPISVIGADDFRKQINENGFANLFYWKKLSNSAARALLGVGEHLVASFNSGTWLYFCSDEDDLKRDDSLYEWYRITRSTARALCYTYMPYEWGNNEASNFNRNAIKSPVFSFPSGTWYWLPPEGAETDSINGILDYASDDYKEFNFEWVLLSKSTARVMSSTKLWWFQLR